MNKRRSFTRSNRTSRMYRYSPVRERLSSCYYCVSICAPLEMREFRGEHYSWSGDSNLCPRYGTEVATGEEHAYIDLG